MTTFPQWLPWALLSAAFAALTAIFAKLGLRQVEPFVREVLEVARWYEAEDSEPSTWLVPASILNIGRMEQELQTIDLALLFQSDSPFTPGSFRGHVAVGYKRYLQPQSGA